MFCAKEQNVLPSFSVLCKRTLWSLRSIPFFAKEYCVRCVLFRSVQKSGKERNVLLGLISRQKLEKRTEKNGTFLLKNGKERNVPNGKERCAQPWLLLTLSYTQDYLHKSTNKNISTLLNAWYCILSLTKNFNIFVNVFSPEWMPTPPVNT